MSLDLTGIPVSLVSLIEAEIGDALKGFAFGLTPVIQTPPCFVVGPPAAVPADMSGEWNYLVAVGVRVPNSDREPSYRGLASFVTQIAAVLDGASESWGSMQIDRIDAPTIEGAYLEQLIQLTVMGA